MGSARRCAALAHNPDEFAQLRPDPKARAAFEEALRLESPVQTFFRTTTRDVELGGAAVPEGAKVLMLLGAANRDPRKWPHADRYDIDRATTGHVAFGGGVHMCVGQLLARLEGETLLCGLGARLLGDRARRRAGAAVQQHAARLGAAAGEGDGGVRTVVACSRNAPPQAGREESRQHSPSDPLALQGNRMGPDALWRCGALFRSAKLLGCCR